MRVKHSRHTARAPEATEAWRSLKIIHVNLLIPKSKSQLYYCGNMYDFPVYHSLSHPWLTSSCLSQGGVLQAALFNVQCWFWRPFARVRWLTVSDNFWTSHCCVVFLLYFTNQASIIGVFGWSNQTGQPKPSPTGIHSSDFKTLTASLRHRQLHPCIKSSLAWLNR